jgi:hypothetical protein
MLPIAYIYWPPYTGLSVFLLFGLLLLVSAGSFLFGRRMKHDIKLPKMGKIVGAIVVVIWAFSILTFLKFNEILARRTGTTGSLGPIFPITVISAFCTFGYVAYISRHDGVGASIGRGFLAFIAGPMIFELPYVLIVVPKVKAPLVPEIIFLIPLFTIIFTTLSMLFFSKKVAITKYSVYLFALMLFVFALWALDGYSYPSNPFSFLMNAISKVLSFAAAAAMFAIKSPASLSGTKENLDQKIESRQS